MNQALLKYTAHVGSAALSFGPYCGTEVDYLSVFRFFFYKVSSWWCAEGDVWSESQREVEKNK